MSGTSSASEAAHTATFFFVVMPSPCLISVTSSVSTRAASQKSTRLSTSVVSDEPPASMPSPAAPERMSGSSPPACCARAPPPLLLHRLDRFLRKLAHLPLRHLREELAAHLVGQPEARAQLVEAVPVLVGDRARHAHHLLHRRLVRLAERRLVRALHRGHLEVEEGAELAEPRRLLLVEDARRRARAARTCELAQLLLVHRHRDLRGDGGEREVGELRGARRTATRRARPRPPPPPPCGRAAPPPPGTRRRCPPPRGRGGRAAASSAASLSSTLRSWSASSS